MAVIWLVSFLITFLACILGTICGMGGGIIIKPVLDAAGVMDVSAINFLSGCTVITMSCWNVGKSFLKKESAVELRTTGVLAVGAAIGGLLGKELYNAVAGLFPDQNTAGGVQAALLLTATLATLIYTTRKDKIKPRSVSLPLASLLIGLLLGMLGSFLGLGGGPFNVAVLMHFFSMPTKKASQNSLFIVLFSQVTSTAKTVFFGSVPKVDAVILVGMVLLSIAGSEFGRRINRKIDNRQATICLEGTMILVMVISVFNIVKFFR